MTPADRLTVARREVRDAWAWVITGQVAAVGMGASASYIAFDYGVMSVVGASVFTFILSFTISHNTLPELRAAQAAAKDAERMALMEAVYNHPAGGAR